MNCKKVCPVLTLSAVRVDNRTDMLTRPTKVDTPVCNKVPVSSTGPNVSVLTGAIEVPIATLPLRVEVPLTVKLFIVRSVKVIVPLKVTGPLKIVAPLTVSLLRVV